MTTLDLEYNGEIVRVVIPAKAELIDVPFGQNARYRRVIANRQGIDLIKRRQNGFGQRGKIKTRSYMATRRLIESLAKHSRFLDMPTMFLTLTYGREAPNWTRAKRDFDVWLKVARRLNPILSGFWVAEEQKRGAPHFHLLVDLLTPAATLELKEHWLRISGDNRSSDTARQRYGFHVRESETHEDSATSGMYLAKILTFEAAKRSQQSTDEFMGRTWGLFNRTAMKQYEQSLDENSVSEEWLIDWIRERFRIAEETGKLRIKLVEDVDTGETVAIWHPRQWSIDNLPSSNDNR